MRTDVKVGLICAFAIILGVVIYFVAQGNVHGPSAARGATGTPAPATTPAAAHVTPAPAARVVAQVTPDPMAGPLVLPPGPTTAPGSGTLDIAPTPGLGGGNLVPAPNPSLGTGMGGSGTGPTGGSGSGFGGPGTGSGSGRTVGGSGSGMGGSGMGGSGSGRGSIDPPGGGPHLPAPRDLEPIVPPLGGSTYVIVKGDTLLPIAHKFGVTLAALQAANPGVDSTKLKINQVIKIPAPSATPATTHPAATRAATRPTSRPAGHAATSPGPSGPAKPGATYTVKRGDTLSTISLAAYGSKNEWKKIADANKDTIKDANIVAIGTVLHLPN